jgi:Spy/CpxP family protein refolding chaperone
VTFASMAARGASRQHLLWVLLALSLVLNLCFIGGAFWIRIHPPAAPFSPEQRLQQIAPELALDPSQQEAFDHFAKIVHVHMQQMRETVEPLMHDAWSELARPDADEARVIQLFDEAADQRRSFRREVMTAMLSFLATLSPPQRAKFVELARRRPARSGQQHQAGAP